jgi:hypothetical protein
MFSLLVLVTAALAGPAPAASCDQLRSAHQKLLSGSFSMERHLTVLVDGDQRAQEVARIDYAGGKVTRTVQKQEFAGNKKMEIEIQGDPAIKLKFDCRSFQPLANDRYRFHSRDEKEGEEEIVFALDTQRGALVPLSWTATQTAKLLFIKKTLKLMGENKSFEWH